MQEHILLQLEEMQVYQLNDKVKASSLYFVDDLILLAEENSQAEPMIRKRRTI
jgi:hypothetical protein